VSVDGLIALKTDPPPVTVADAERLARELYDIAAQAQALPGERDRNFRLNAVDGCGFVLKVIDPGADEAILHCQRRVLQHQCGAVQGSAEHGRCH
jgi:Ser/Thr protein kinase RdoA (MazF antagonist)